MRLSIKTIELTLGSVLNYYTPALNKRNSGIQQQYTESVAIIRDIHKETAKRRGPIAHYLHSLSQWIMMMVDVEEQWSKHTFAKKSNNRLQKENEAIYAAIKSKAYVKSFANPVFSVSCFGERLGPIFSYFFACYRKYTNFSFKQKRFEIEKWNRLFIELYTLIDSKTPSRNKLIELTTRIEGEQTLYNTTFEVLERFDPSASTFYLNILKKSSRDLRYLYLYGKNITKNEIVTAQHLATLSNRRIGSLADTLFKSYARGFSLARKDIHKKRHIALYYNIGQERIIRSLIKRIEESGFKPLIIDAFTTNPNRQFTYDHRYDKALYLDNTYIDRSLHFFKQVCTKYKRLLSYYAGPIYFDKFGEKGFSPKQKRCCIKLSKSQQKLLQQFNVQKRTIQDKFIPRSETSFSIVAFPVPEIGRNYKKIFDETLAINMIDSQKYERIQQRLVDTLDRATHVLVKGKGKNKTNMKVSLHALNRPQRETNFENCGATLNIPVGEVFTTPLLKGTNGTLHVSQCYLQGLKYTNLRLTFSDGFVSGYDCSNFKKSQDNKRYIEENILFHHKTLPLGEFAIGTNTAAYMMAKKYDILAIMPILIVEKMGPHFAVGDTCYSWEEDFKVYNPIDKKEIIARDNEKSILRKKDVQKAYMGCHTDITLPYEELGAISVITAEGEEIGILRNGRFIVPGTEKLNLPLDAGKKH